MAISKKIRGVWSKYKSMNSKMPIELNVINSIALEKGLVINKCIETNFSLCCAGDIRSIYIETTEGNALYPCLFSYEEMYQRININIKRYIKFWHTADWFLPPYVTMEDIHNNIKKYIDLSSWEKMDIRQLQESFDKVIPLYYPIEKIIVLVCTTFPKSQAVSSFVPLIKESIKSYSLGFEKVAIGALIPIVEAMLNKVIGTNDLKIIEKVNKCFDDLVELEVVRSCGIKDAFWIPDEFYEKDRLEVLNERVQVFESIRYWLINSFYSNTGQYNNYSGLNRHLYSHGLSDAWQRPNNFFRCIGVIIGMVFIDCLSDTPSSFSLLGESPNEEAHAFYNEILFLKGAGDYLKKHLAV